VKIPAQNCADSRLGTWQFQQLFFYFTDVIQNNADTYAIKQNPGAIDNFTQQ